MPIGQALGFYVRGGGGHNMLTSVALVPLISQTPLPSSYRVKAVEQKNTTKKTGFGT